MPEVLAGRVFTLEGVTTVRVTVLLGCDDAGTAGFVVVVAPVVAGRVTVVVVVAGRLPAVAGLASVLGEVTVVGLLAEVPLVGLALVPAGAGCVLISVGFVLLEVTASVRAPVTVLRLSPVGLVLALLPTLPTLPPWLPALPMPVAPLARLS